MTICLKSYSVPCIYVNFSLPPFSFACPSFFHFSFPFPPSLLLPFSSPPLASLSSFLYQSPIPLPPASPTLLLQSFLGSAEHLHDHSDAAVAEERVVLWKGSVLLGAILLFYIFEFFMKYWQDRAKVMFCLHKNVVIFLA